MELRNSLFFILGSLVLVQRTYSQWMCQLDNQCSVDVPGSVCIGGVCQCSAGQDLAAGGCVNIAPYHTSACVDDAQCSRLFLGFECRWDSNSTEGSCRCQPGFHYLHGRCWRSTAYGAACLNSEECYNNIADPYSLSCEGTCLCSPGYYLRQRGECRRIASGVGDSCVVSDDCQFENGVCNIATLECELQSDGATRTNSKSIKNATVNTQSRTNPMQSRHLTMQSSNATSRQHGVACGVNNACEAPFVCAGVCICPIGYYASEDGLECYAELGMPSTAAQCVGELAEVSGGRCLCPVNFFYSDNMRDCVKASRTLSDTCVSDESCHSFGAAASCGAPQTPWGLRSCTCNTTESVWDSNRLMCRYFSGIGETCEVDSDCLAGELEVQCVADEGGQGRCACPGGLQEYQGLCITSGLDLGAACQATPECDHVLNAICSGGACSCSEGYMAQDGTCAPIIGGVCTADSDCLISNTVCVNGTADEMTCQCGGGFVAYDEECWLVSHDFNAACTVDAQCTETLGPYSACINGACDCQTSYHYRDDNCWPMTGLFEPCSRSSQCFLGEHTDRVVCRNSQCQCDFNYPYSEELNECVSGSSSSTIYSSATTIVAAIYLLLR